MLVITNRYGSDFFGQSGYNRWGLYHIRRVEDRPVSALFLGFAGHDLAWRRLCSGACEWVLVYTVERIRACMRLCMVW